MSLCQSDKIMSQGAIFCCFVKATKKCFFKSPPPKVCLLVKETRKHFFEGVGPFFKVKEIAMNLGHNHLVLTSF